MILTVEVFYGVSRVSKTFENFYDLIDYLSVIFDSNFDSISIGKWEVYKT